MKKNLVLLAVLLCAVTLQAEEPTGYYSVAEGKTTSSLKSALSSIIDNHKSTSYDGLYTIYNTSDVTADGKVWDMYSTCTWTPGNKKCGNYSGVCDCYNREHSVPQSWFSKKSPMVSDAFHVYPTDGKVNGQRSSYPFGECANGKSLGGNALGKLGTCTFGGYSGTVFEPVDEYKGDFARTYFYFVTRYESQMSSFSGEGIAKNTYPSLPDWVVTTFLKWHRQDPVSAKEITRNDAVYAHQKNRNPFIDHPELVEYVWGSKKGENWYLSLSAAPSVEVALFEVGPNPAKDIITLVSENNVSFDVEFYELSGRMVKRVEAVQANSTLSVSDMENGVYLLKAIVDGRSSVTKLIIAR